ERLDKERWDRWERERKEMRRDIGGIGKSQGEYAEQFFQRAMKHTHSFCGIEYKRVSPNLASNVDGIDEEYDIVLHNGDSLVLIEVKYKFQLPDLKTFMNRKAVNFRKLFPEFADKTIYLAVAGFSFAKGVADEALKLGLAVLQKDGKNVEISGNNLKAF
ncbi:MAG: hypothetical protein LBH00_06050, partial [Planctomycetaceae bacterium]|nr:hypothetical protein [Planctomycetaceae bacterium]